MLLCGGMVEAVTVLLCIRKGSDVSLRGEAVGVCKCCWGVVLRFVVKWLVMFSVVLLCSKCV